MGYKKLVVSGRNLELYEYEQDLPRRTEKPSKIPSVSPYNGDGAVLIRKPLVDYQKRKDNAGRAALAFRRLVASNLGGPTNPSLLTFTYSDNMSDLSVGYKDLTSFVVSLRYRYGSGFKYIAVPEFQKRGAVHFHALFWGIPEKLLLEERKTRAIATLWGKGFLFIKPTDGNDKLSSYLAKYMSKSFIDPLLRNQKAYVSSRNVVRPYVASGSIDNMDVLVSEFMKVDNFPCRDISFTSQWLGKGRYRQYEV